MVLPLPLTMRWDLPPWAQDLVQPEQRFPTVSERMELAVELSRRNVAERTGDPFGAAVFDLSTFRPLAVGVNVVAPSATVAAHAEVVAPLPGRCCGGEPRCGGGNGGPVELVTSCAPA